MDDNVVIKKFLALVYILDLVFQAHVGLGPKIPVASGPVSPVKEVWCWYWHMLQTEIKYKFHLKVVLFWRDLVSIAST